MPRHSFTAPLYQRQEGRPAARPLQPMPPRAGKGQEQEAGDGRASVRKIWGRQNASLIKSSLKESFKQNQAKGLAACPFFLRVQMVPGHPVRDGPAQAGGWTRWPPEGPANLSQSVININIINEYNRISTLWKKGYAYSA